MIAGIISYQQLQQGAALDLGLLPARGLVHHDPELLCEACPQTICSVAETSEIQVLSCLEGCPSSVHSTQLDHIAALMHALTYK